MARSRNIKPDLFKNELLGDADPLLTILFTGLWCLADREGKLLDRPKRIKAEIFPYRELPDFNGYLTELEQLGFIERYSVEEVAIIKVLEFKKHQSPHKTEKASELPDKPRQSRVKVKAPLNNGSITEEAALIPDSGFLIPDSKTTTTSASEDSNLLDENFAQESSHRQVIDENHPVWKWMPSQIVMQEISRFRIPVEFVSEQLSEFKAYRSGLDENFTNYDSKFLANVQRSWKRIGHTWQPSPIFNGDQTHDSRNQSGYQQGPKPKLSTVERYLLEDAERIRQIDNEIREAEAQERNESPMGVTDS